jgi:hypothetical protein
MGIPAVAVRRLAAAAAAGFILAACGTSQPQATTTPTPAATPTLSPVAIKPALAGLLSRDGPPPAAFGSVFGGFVVNVAWAQLQASAGADIAANNPIDQAIAQLRQLDATGKDGLKIRLLAGTSAPDWLKNLGGSPITVLDPTTGTAGTIGRFWSADFGAAYNDLMTKLAARYDSVPEVREITISRCTTVYAEPFIRDAASPMTVSNLLAAGFTVAADQQCQRDEIAAHDVWKGTRSDLSFNPYQVLGGTSRQVDEVFTEQMMDLCRSTLGARCVLANNSLRVPPLYPDMYNHMKALGPPIAFQTASLNRVGNLGSALDAAITLGAGSVELPSGFDKTPLSALATYDQRLAAQAPAG